MEQNFIDQKINLKEVLKNASFDSCIFENNEKCINDICDFLINEQKLLLVGGLKGSGKTLTVDFVSEFLNEEVLTLRYTCFETSILDDMLLEFFEEFRNYAIAEKITLPKRKVDNFSQRINLYFNSIPNKMLIIIDSLDALIKNNRFEILSFIKYLLNLSNIKVILISEKFNTKDIEDFEYSATQTQPFTKSYYEKFLRNGGIKNIGPLTTELYNQTQGIYDCVNLSLKIMQNRGYNISQYLDAFSKSLVLFKDFIYREALTFVDPQSAHLFSLLTAIRIPISFNLLKALHLYDEPKIGFFISISLLEKLGESVYLKENYREIIERQISENVMIKLHQACIDLYETQLPLKPLERDLILSRQTMRNEIEYHNSFIPKKYVRPEIPQQNEEYQTEINQEEISTVQIEEPDIIPVPVQTEENDTKEDKLSKINFIIEDKNLIENIAGSITEFVNENVQQNEFVKEHTNLSIIELLNCAKKEEHQYNFKGAVILYQNALAKKDDPDYDKFLPNIYIKLAQNYKHLSQWYEALEAYTNAQDFYYNVSQISKVNQIKIEIANIYFIVYKYDNANYILNELEQNQELTNNMRIKINLLRSEMTDNISKVNSYYKQSLEMISEDTPKSVLTELYYKYAGLNDDQGNIKNAIIYYNKCIETEPDVFKNKYLSSALLNIAQIYDETENTDYAIKYYNKSIEADKLTKNYNGLFISTRNLAQLYIVSDPKQYIEYMAQTLGYSKALNEPYYVADTLYEIGNYYLSKLNMDSAYKYLKDSLEILKTSSRKEILPKVTSRLEYIKGRVGEVEYKRLEVKYAG